MSAAGVGVRIGDHSHRMAAMLDRLVADRVASRLFAKDSTLWGDDAQREAAERLGWVDPFARSLPVLAEAEALRDALRVRGIDRIVLCGMGGSSLGPEVISRWAGTALELLDSTHPAAVRRRLAGDLARTAVVVSSKSGTTIETRSHLAAFEAAYAAAGLPAADHIVVVTDPGSDLERHARSFGYRCFLADPHVGGRFSALTAFGVVPSVLAGADMAQLLAQARAVHQSLSEDAVENPALLLASALASELPERYVVAVTDGEDAPWGLGEWIEQLVAESTGKQGRGVLPIALPPQAAEVVGALAERCVGVRVRSTPPLGEPLPHRIEVSGALGAQLLLWETATAVLGHLLQIDPFNQPDVEAAKVAARAALAEASASQPAASQHGSDTKLHPTEVLSKLRDGAEPEGYVVVQAYLDPEGGLVEKLAQLREGLARELGVPVALGWGPRYLHSTGQMHKGGQQLGVFLQLLDRAAPELEIPGSASGFGALIHAQARGDRHVLTGQGRTVVSVTSDDPEAFLADMIEAL